MWPISAPSAPTSGSRTRRETYTRRSAHTFIVPRHTCARPGNTRCRRSSVLLALPLGAGTAMTSLRILGPVEVWQGEQRLALGGPRQLALFAFLVLHPNRAVSRDELIDALWGPARSATRTTGCRWRSRACARRSSRSTADAGRALADGQGRLPAVDRPGRAGCRRIPRRRPRRLARARCGRAGAGGRAAHRGAGAVARAAAGRGRIRGLRPG